MKDFSYVTGPNPAYIESLYNEFAKDSSAVDPEWKKFFEGFDFAIAQSPSSRVVNLTGNMGNVVPRNINNEHIAKEIGCLN